MIGENSLSERRLDVVKVIHGANDGLFPLAGAMICTVRSSLVDAFNLTDDAVAFVNGELIGLNYRLREWDTLEFFVRWGRKGGGQTSSDCPLTVKEAAAELRCSISFVYKLMRLGELSYEKRGRRKLPLRGSVEEYRSRNVVQALLTPKSDRQIPGPKRYKHLFN